MSASGGAALDTVVMRARGVTVRFGPVVALSGVDFEIRPGAVHALVGENGAGKSTLMRVLSGALRPEAGTLQLGNAVVAFGSPRDARRAGVRMIHQELSLVPALSVAENVFLGAEPSTHGVVNRGRMRDDTHTVFAALGEEIDPDARVETLSLARREMVEIAKALAAPHDERERRPGGLSARDLPVDASRLRVLILDEPTAILSARETDALFARIAALKLAGVGIVYCSHRLEEIAQLADEVTVLRDGVRVAHGQAGSLSREEMIRLMVGRAPRSGAAPSADQTAEDASVVVLQVEGLRTTVVREASLTLHAGELVALVGLVGAGRTELARAIVGADRRQSGDILIDGRRVEFRSPGEAARVGIAYVSEDRKAGALVPQASVRQNITLARLPSFARSRLLPVIDQARERMVAASWVDSLRIKISDLDEPVDRLSGGNQQKIVLARWLVDQGPRIRVLIVDEPTRGVDAGAREEIHAVLRDVARRGTAVLAITSDLEEAFALSDRLLVMREGRITGSLLTREAQRTQVATLMVPE